ncbi:MAG: PQQ-binding-like beta-propeller repeat protein, partial [Phycisphaerae bacterium]
REICWMPRRDDLRIHTVFFWRPDGAGGRVMRAGDRVFAVDPGFRLKTAKPLTGDEAVWTTLPQSPRDLAPLDAHRVFVALNDRTAALYEEGKDQPLWRRRFSLGRESYVSAGPEVITAAEEDGTLHALDPATGRTRWTRQVETRRWTSETGLANRTVLRQAGGVVLVPDRRRPTQLECVDAATGRHLWSVRTDAQFGQVALGDNLVLLGSESGHVTAMHPRTGATVFDVAVCPAFEWAEHYMRLAVGPAGRQVYAAIGRNVWALDAASGKVLWQWTWQAPKRIEPLPRSYRPAPRLYPVEDGLFGLFNWEEGTAVPPHKRHVDVVRFAADGEVRVHETSPRMHGHLVAFATGRHLAILNGLTHWEIWEFLPATP